MPWLPSTLLGKGDMTATDKKRNRRRKKKKQQVHAASKRSDVEKLEKAKAKVAYVL